MKKLLERVKEMIPILPGKDANLVEEYLNKRDFQSVLEIIESDLYKAEKTKYNKLEIISDDYIAALTEMKGELLAYMSYLEIPDNFDNYDYYYYQ